MPTDEALYSAVLNAIRHPRIREEIKVLLGRSIAAIEDLSAIDAALYDHYRRAQEGTLEEDDALAFLRDLADQTFRGVHTLDDYLGRYRAAAQEDAEDPEELDFDLDFDMEPDDAESGDVQFDDEAIADALDQLVQETKSSPKEQWSALKGQIGALGYALHTQLRQFDASLDDALKSEVQERILHELNEAGNSLIDGILALLGAICDVYLGDVDRATIIPGHRNELEKALLVRRGFTELRRKVRDANSVIQSEDADEELQSRAFRQIIQVLQAFLEGEVFPVVRAADRLELENFSRDLAASDPRSGRTVCEGLDKYLESLAAVSRRDVLLQYDREQSKEIAELLEAATSLLEISASGARDLLRQALDKAQPLFGWSEPLDDLLIALRQSPPRLEEPGAVAGILAKLSRVFSARQASSTG